MEASEFHAVLLGEEEMQQLQVEQQSERHKNKTRTHRGGSRLGRDTQSSLSPDTSSSSSGGSPRRSQASRET
ncbi:hypothetical protein AMECASPLE_037608 [Ameca splendens]|uniref:Uncharacterized protein n=1 Tax=Ameca splendens TaxID=208324 RepID=A0ABV0YJD8_9TELE